MSCELTEIESMDSIQTLFDDVIGDMIRCFGALIINEPLSASSLAINISKYFIEAISNMSSNNYIYEPSAILPIGASIKALCTTVIDCVTNHTVPESLLKLESVSSVRIVF